jgi:hypothetical protein
MPVWALLVFASSAARAQSFASYPLGERGSGFGGAYTALADDSAGSWYNPAGPAFADGNSLSMSTSLYGLVAGHTNALLGEGGDFTYSTLNLIPTTTASLWHLGPRREGDLPSRWVLALNLYAPVSFQVSNRVEAERGNTVVSLSSNQRRLFAGPTVAVRITERFSLGASLYGQIDTYTFSLDLLKRFSDQPGVVNSFVDATVYRDYTAFGLTGAFGLRFEPVEHLTFGAMVQAPSAALWGKGSVSSKQVVSNAAANASQASVVTHEVQVRQVVPTQLRFGAAYQVKEKWSLALDVSVHLPLTYRQLTQDDGVSVDERLNANVNVALGGELHVAHGHVLRMGVFSDFSPYSTPTPTGEDTNDRLDSVGLSLAYALVTPATSTAFGLVGSYSVVQALGVDLTQGTANTFLTYGNQWRVFVLFSSSYNY